MTGPGGRFDNGVVSSIRKDSSAFKGDVSRLTPRSPTLSEQVRAHAFETFGQEAKAIHWLNRPNHLFGGKTPAEVLETEPDSVERELIRIDHGIFV